MSMWFCPECYSTVEQGGLCACARPGIRHVLFSAPGETPAVIGHLALLDDAPRPWSLLETVCDGPRRYPDQVPAPSRCGCWRHKSRTVWMWQDNAENLPAAGTLPNRDSASSSMSLLRAIGETNLLLIEAPQQTPLFRAHYIRNKSKGQSLPELAQIIDRLQWVFSLSAARGRAIALLDDGQGAGTEDRLRLAAMSSSFGIFEQRAEALRWLLEKAAGVSTLVRPATDRRSTGPEKKAAARRGPSGRSSSSGGKKDREKERRDQVDSVCVADVGGSVGRQLLARLHAAAWTALDEAGLDLKATGTKKNAVVRLRCPVWSHIGFTAHVTTERLRYGRIHQLRNSPPAPGCAVPAWAGHLTRWWMWKQPFTVALAEDKHVEKTCPLIVGVGTSRLFGERELTRLLEEVWRGRWTPAAIMRHGQADPNLLQWVRKEFPRVPEFPDSWEGGIEALKTALRVARLQASL